MSLLISVCDHFNFILLGISFRHLLDKPPDPQDLFDLIKGMSSSWYEVSHRLKVPMEDLDNSLCEEAKLKQILLEWIQNETKEVKWSVILEVLHNLRRKDLIKKVTKYLEQPEVYSKYSKKDDFSFCPQI